MFKCSKYTHWYYQIIHQATVSANVRTKGYYERHHIIPKSLGGTHRKENLVKLTAREHYVCHQLLARMTEGAHQRKMAYALWIINNKNTQGKQLTSRQYAALRTQISKQVSERQRGKIVSAETRAKQSASKKITHNTPQMRAANSERQRNRPQHLKDALAALQRGKTISLKHRRAITTKLSGAGNGRALVWNVEFEDGQVEQVTALKEWCAQTNRTYPGVFRTIKSRTFSQGVRVARS
jgi:hypothetical protein